MKWYETTGSTYNSTRIVYYTNGTVNKETWTYTAATTADTSYDSFIAGRVQTIVSTLVKSP